MATYLDLVKQDAKEIMLGIDTQHGFDNLYKDVKNSVSKLDFNIESQEKIKEQLLQLDKKLVDYYGEVT